MGESMINNLPAILFEHMKVGFLFYVKPIDLQLSEIDELTHLINISASAIPLVLKDLITHGIITAKFRGDSQLCYRITSFGVYFFEKLCSTNEEAESVCKKVGVIVNEKDDT